MDQSTINGILIGVLTATVVGVGKWIVSSVRNTFVKITSHMDRQDDQLTTMNNTLSATSETVGKLNLKVDGLTNDVTDMKVKTEVLWHERMARINNNDVWRMPDK